MIATPQRRWRAVSRRAGHLGARLGVALALGVCALPGAQGAAPGPRDATVSRTADGRRIIHRRLPASGSGGGQAVFIYDPVHGGALPEELQRDGQALPRPTDAGQGPPDDAVYGANGVHGAQAETGIGIGSEVDTHLPATGPVDLSPEAPTSATDARTAEAATEPALPPDGAPGEAAPNPASASADGEHAPPEGPPPPGPSSQAPGPDDPRGGLGDVARPDRRTGRESTLEYRTVFDPSVVPFKRNRALDRVTRAGDIALGGGPLRAVTPEGNRVAAGREAFWGSLLIDAQAAERTPIPSVAPDSRILSYEASPAMALSFERDGADNLYVTAPRSGRFRLIVMMDAPTGYFGRPLPKTLRLADIPRQLRPRLPAPIARQARAVAEAIGVDRSGSLAGILDQLVRYFRSFEPGEPPPASGDVYRDLALGQTGVCRHRGYAFVITAQALGIPARYVFNEAHVFAEVYIPGQDAGWLRVDLGGGAERLVVHGSEDKTLHRPRGRDPFSEPEGYAAQRDGGMTAGATEVEGMPDAGRRMRPHPGAEGIAPDRLPEVIRALLSAAIPRPAPALDKPQTRTSLKIPDAIAFRGEPMGVEGRVTDRQGRPVRHGTVQILLLQGRERAAVALIGTASLRPDGRYTALVHIAGAQSPGDYEIVAEFMGNDAFAPSISP